MNEINKLEELKKTLMTYSTNFHNLNLMTEEQLVLAYNCDGCRDTADSNKIDYRNICKSVSKAVSFLESLVEFLLSSYSMNNASKISLAFDGKNLIETINLFLITRLNIIISEDSSYDCVCKNHSTLDQLAEISFKINEIRININKKAID